MLDLVSFLTDPKVCACSQLYEVKGLIGFVWGVINIIKFAIPVLLIILGMLDLGKAVTAGEEKEIKESQKLLMKRALSAIGIFFVVSIVSLVLRLLPAEEDSGLNIFVCRGNDIQNPAGLNCNVAE